MLTYYFKFVVTLAIVTISYGFGVPTFVSAANNILVLAGFALAVVTPVLIYLLWSDELGAIFTNPEKTEETSVKEKSKPATR